MAVRYIPKTDFVVGDKHGRRRRFSVKRVRQDGTAGYTTDELKGLYKDQMGMFRQVDVTSPEIEQATQAPGEKRARRPKKESSDTTENE